MTFHSAPNPAEPATRPGIAGMLDPLTAQGDLKSFAESKGIDFNKLVSGAARHFTSASIARRTSPLSSKELERLFEDDQQSLSQYFTL